MFVSITPLQGNFTKAVAGTDFGFSTDNPINTFTTFDGIWRLSYFVIFLLVVGVVIIGSLKGGVFSDVFGSASGSSLNEAKKWWSRALFGSIFAILIYLIPFTFYPEMLRANISFQNLFAGGFTGKAKSLPLEVKTPPFEGKDISNASDAIKADAAVRKQLNDANISVNKPVCKDPTQRDCTTVGGWAPTTVPMLLQLRNACNQGNLQVTGGTEAGHITHGPGKTPVDLSMGDSLINTCIRSFNPGPYLGFCKKTYIGIGYIFCDELPGNDHWHVFK